MKYLKSYKLFERVTVPDFEISTDCGTCLATKSGKSLKSSPQETPQSSDDSQNSNKPTSGSKKIESPYNVQKQKFFKDNPGAEAVINKIFNSSKKWYIDHYMKPETLKKFKNGANRDELVNFINKEIKLQYWNRNSNSGMFKIWEKEYSDALGWVWPDRFSWLNLNMENYENDGYKQTIPHELGHCIYYKLKQLGEDPISGNKDASKSISPNFRGMGVNPSLLDEERSGLQLQKIIDQETDILDESENQTRIMSLRQLLNIGPIDTCEQIKQKFESNIKNGKLKFDYLEPQGFVKNKNGDCYWLKLKVHDQYKGYITDSKYSINGEPRLGIICSLLTCSLNGKGMDDFIRLFSVFSQYRDGFIWLDLSGLTQLNLDVVTNDSPEDFIKIG